MSSSKTRITTLCVALLSLAGIGAPAAHGYYDAEHSKITIGYFYNESSQVSGLTGRVKPRSFYVCADHRPVRIRFTTPEGGHVDDWVLTKGNAVWTEQDPNLQPGTYRAAVRAEIRFKHIDGKRRKILCRASHSPLFTVPSS